MSEFCGKCDIWDSLVNIGRVDDNTDWSKIEIYQNDIRLPISSLKDLIKYAPYLIRCSFSSKGSGVYHITDRSFIDSEEEESLNFRLKWAKQIYRRCKREGTEFVPEEVAAQISFSASPVDIEICRRVKEHPYTKNIRGLHTNIHQFFREIWYDAMLDYGYTEAEAKAWIYK